MRSLEKFAEIKRRVEELKAERDKALGALEQLLMTLQKEHGCQSLEEAEQKLRNLEQQYARQSESFEKALAEFEEKWREQLDPAPSQSK